MLVGSSLDASDDENSAAAAPRRSQRGTVVASVAMTVLALGGFVVAAGWSGASATIDETTATQVYELRDRIRSAQTQAEALPVAVDAERGLVNATTSAQQVAVLQNGYRSLNSPGASDISILSSQRALTPYFTPTTDPTSLGPWYLLEADSQVPAGNGLLTNFDSGFEWVAQTPQVIETDGSIQVVWLAQQTRTAPDQKPAVLAQASASFDLTRRTFYDLEIQITSTGQQYAAEVTHS